MSIFKLEFSRFSQVQSQQYFFTLKTKTNLLSVRLKGICLKYISSLVSCRVSESLFFTQSNFKRILRCVFTSFGTPVLRVYTLLYMHYIIFNNNKIILRVSHLYNPDYTMRGKVTQFYDLTKKLIDLYVTLSKCELQRFYLNNLLLLN